MKKIIFLISMALIFTSCLTKVNVDNKGSLSLNIKWPESNMASNGISKSIKPGTTKIIVTLENTQTAEICSQTITHSGETSHNVEFKDLAAGKWYISISCYDAIDTPISLFYDYIDISTEAPTIVQTQMGAPQKIVEPYENTVSTGFVNLGVQYTGSTDLELPQDATNAAIVTLYISDKEDFSNIIYSNEYGTVSVSSSTAFWSIPYGIESNLNANTKYYWKVVTTGTGSALPLSSTSNIFSFTTGA